jgi:Flp pilus assembly protein TadB
VTFVVLFILAVAWAVYLVNWARSRSEHRSVDSISRFSQHLSVLERTSPGRTGNPSLARPAFAPMHARRTGMTRRQARERRKNVLLALGAAVMVTLAGAVALGGPMLYLNLMVDVLLVAYIGLLVHTRRMAEERQAKVRYLPQTIDLTDPAPVPAPAFLLQQSVN